jgi:MerR family transcriptional regulator/heat shock protein HspR
MVSQPVPRRRETTVAIRHASATLSLHPQTLRKYERAGLLRPARQKSGARDYSASDLERLELIKHLGAVRGINVAGMVLLLELHDELQGLLAAIQEPRAARDVSPEARVYGMLARLRGE